MDKTISVHWHGIFQNGTNYMDGTPYSTQCPITPGDSFTYEFSAANQAGTYWYRADSWDQSNGGVVGPLIIYDPSDPQKGLYDIDDESTIVMLSDYYHTNPRDLATSYLSPASNGVEPVPDNGLIGGLNTFDSAGSRKVFNFARGKRYRLRVINAGAFAAFQFSIDNHMLTVIEADGVAIQPVTVQRLPINVGQRYSVIVHSNQPVGNYWMRAVMNTDCFFAKNSALDPVTKAIVHYAGAPDIGPRSSDWESVPWSGGCVDLALNLLKPLVEQNAPPADLRVILNMSFQKTPNGVRAYVNGTSWDSPTSPTLLQVLNGANGDELVPPKTVIVLDKIQTVEVIINNPTLRSQTLHLHGHIFYIVGSGKGNYLPDQSPINTVNPPRRDTVTTEPNGYTVLRFVNDNPGVWAFHSQIEWHRLAGLLVQFLSLPSATRALTHPQSWDRLCPKLSDYLTNNP